MSQGNRGVISGAQIRAGRALIHWSAADLSKRSSVSLRTIRRAELAEHDMRLTVANNLAIRRALEAAGVEFTNGDQPGVKLARWAITGDRTSRENSDG
jgi:hypothetical protein